jgi:transposase
VQDSHPSFYTRREKVEQGNGRFVGVDLAKKSMEACILSEGRDALRSNFRTDAAGRNRLRTALLKTDTVAVEACALAFVLARELKREVGCRVHVLNPGRLAVIWKSTRKTDKEDAYKLASLIQRFREDELPVVAVPDEREERMRSVISMKHYLVKLRTSMLNRLHAIYVQAGMTFVKKSEIDTTAARERMAEQLTDYLARFASIIEKELTITEEQIAGLDKEIRMMVAEHELAPYVMSMPGVGPGVAAAFLAYVGDGSRFSGPAQVANYIGLVPRIDCSGETNRYGHITKDGCRAIRGVILQSTWALIRCKEGGRLKEKFFLLSERKGKTKSAVALARRMVGLMWILVTRHELYADAPKEMLRKKFRQYGLRSEGWESIVA